MPFNEADAERALRSLELFGMRFGLDRMRRMMTVLGSPERAFDAIQVLGTNGKSSTTRIAAAILQAHGLRTGAYTSPHLVSYRERIRIDGEPLAPGAFAAAVAHASRAAERVNRTLASDDHVTQFELLTAAAFCALAAREVQAGVIEAGLGGRYDATSVIDAPTVVLTNVGLEHTRWLGPTVEAIAEEKLAVVSDGATLVLWAGLAAPALAVARSVAAERGARIVQAPAVDDAGVQLPAGSYQRENFALARTAAETHLERLGIAPDRDAVLAALPAAQVPGRLQLIAPDPPTLLDGAHNPDAVAALVRALAGTLAARPRALVLGVLEDKDAAGMLALLQGHVDRAWFTAPPGERALPPAALQEHARRLGWGDTDIEADPQAALRQARAWARERQGSVLVTGSIYLAGELLAGRAEAGERSAGAVSGSDILPPRPPDAHLR